MMYKPALYRKFERDCKRIVIIFTVALVIAAYLIAEFLHVMFAIPLAILGVYLWLKVARISWSVSDGTYDEITREHNRAFKFWRRYVGA